MRVWDGISNGRIHFSAQDFQQPMDTPMAWILENLNLHRAAVKSLDQMSDKVELIDRTKVVNINESREVVNSFNADDQSACPDWPVVQLDSGRMLQTRLLVGADGANSPVRKYSQIDATGWPYPQHGIVAIMELAEDTRPVTAWQKFLPTGTVAILPMPGNYAALVWSMEKEYVPLLKALSDDDFTCVLNAALQLPFEDLHYFLSTLKAGSVTADHLTSDLTNRLTTNAANVTSPDYKPPVVNAIEKQSRASFPFKLQHADRYIDQRIALIGDAAHTIHPLAGQGLNLGLADVESLVAVLTEAARLGQDFGDYNCLLGYSSARYFPNLAMLGAVDKLQKLFSTGNEPVAFVRSFGFNMVNSMPGFKAWLTKIAMGQ
ncbi:putative ubiquinone biosynthesis monooxygenase [Dispira parvispora]|uniref:Ubiquinone biosynthesis monooxygenase n=1 Tax=Dispira parvispora TaxID=1520584 RepID=A0A9W8E0P1_9FUNG|nr:putative ubiquinone biosynthesis monooxygenase [Dispira parvispora]